MRPRALLAAVIGVVLLAHPASSGDYSMRAVRAGIGSPIRPAKGKLLVATRELGDPNFSECVVLLVAHDDEGGTMGVIVNQPTSIELAAVLPQFHSLSGRGDRLWRGGPVLPTSLLVLLSSKKPMDDSEEVFGDVRMLTSREAVERVLAATKSRARFRAYAGHAGWGPGQLEAEIARGDWVVLPAKAEMVFSESPQDVWPQLLERSEGEWTFFSILRPQRSG